MNIIVFSIFCCNFIKLSDAENSLDILLSNMFGVKSIYQLIRILFSMADTVKNLGEVILNNVLLMNSL